VELKKMETDDGKRGQFGIVVSVAEDDAGGVRLVVDRASRQASQWHATHFVTFKKMQRETLVEMTMTEEDIAALGLVLVAELSAALQRQSRS
jgi:hypothetical protein